MLASRPRSCQAASRAVCSSPRRKPTASAAVLVPDRCPATDRARPAESVRRRRVGQAGGPAADQGDVVGGLEPLHHLPVELGVEVRPGLADEQLAQLDQRAAPLRPARTPVR